MDEPTNGLDIPSKSQFRKVIAAAVSEEKCIVISTHQVRDLDNLIDNIVIIDDHKIVFRQHVGAVSDKLSFKTVSSLEDAGGVVYANSSLRGHAIVTENTDKEQSRIDMEMLFNAVLEQPERISKIFN
jgi:ABC-2 type transport system ATP-binding protein